MTSYPFTEDGVAAALKALGDRPDVVADTLTARGFKGVIDSCSSCPVATYLWAVVEELTDVSVGDDVISLSAARIVDGSQERYHLRHDTPDAVGDFITSFDARGYPDLIKGERHAA